MIFGEIVSKGVRWSSIFLEWMMQIHTKLPKLGGKQEIWQNFCQKYLSEIVRNKKDFVRDIMSKIQESDI